MPWERSDSHVGCLVRLFKRLMNLDETIGENHLALDEFSRGSRARQGLYSHRDDVTLANPFVGPPGS
jgi:hypothetical protein